LAQALNTVADDNKYS